MKLAIIDPGYSHPEAHHQSVNLEIGSALSKQGVQTVIFSSKRVEQRSLTLARNKGLELEPYFNAPCYLKNQGRITCDEYRVLADSFFSELSQLFQSSLMEGVGSLYFHTGFSFHLLGLARALNSLSLKKVNNVIITLMFNPGARIKQDGMNILDFAEYAVYLKAFRHLAESSKENGVKIHLATSCRAYQQVYERLWHVSPVEIHPAINPMSSLNHLEKPPGSKERVILYLGGPKEDKGIQFSAQLCPLAAKSFPNVEFVFHYNSDFPGAKSQFQSVIESLRASSQTQNNILIKEGFLDPDSYQGLLQSSGVVAILYNPSKYNFKTSGIFWDALKLKKQKWLVTRGTWIADELSELGIPYSAVNYGDSEGALIALEKLLAENKKEGDHSLSNKYVDLDYLKILTSSFSDWLLSKITSSSHLVESSPEAA